MLANCSRTLAPQQTQVQAPSSKQPILSMQICFAKASRIAPLLPKITTSHIRTVRPVSGSLEMNAAPAAGRVEGFIVHAYACNAILVNVHGCQSKH